MSTAEVYGADQTGSGVTKTQHVAIGEARTHLSAPLAQVEVGEDRATWRDAMPVAHVTRVAAQGTIRREQARQKAVAKSKVLVL